MVEEGKKKSDEKPGLSQRIALIKNNTSFWIIWMPAILVTQFAIIKAEFDIDAKLSDEDGSFHPALLSMISMRILTLYVQIALFFTITTTQDSYINVCYRIVSFLGVTLMCVSMFTMNLTWQELLNLNPRCGMNYFGNRQVTDEEYAILYKKIKQLCLPTLLGLGVSLLNWLLIEVFANKKNFVTSFPKSAFDKFYVKNITKLRYKLCLFLSICSFMSLLTVVSIASTKIENTELIELFVGAINSLLSFIVGFITFCVFVKGFKPIESQSNIAVPYMHHI